MLPLIDIISAKGVSMSLPVDSVTFDGYSRRALPTF